MTRKILYTKLLVFMLACTLLSLAATKVEAQAPQITSLSDVTLFRSGLLLITGTNFGSEQGTGQVLIDGFDAIATTWTDTEIHAYVPESVPVGSALVQVETASGSSNPISLDVTLRLTDGRILWQFKMDSPFSGQFVATGADGTVYVTDSFRMYALTAAGELLWVLPWRRRGPAHLLRDRRHDLFGKGQDSPGDQPRRHFRLAG